MSIIHDALKKAQDKLTNQENVTPQVPPQEPKNTDQEPKNVEVDIGSLYEKHRQQKLEPQKSSNTPDPRNKKPDNKTPPSPNPQKKAILVIAGLLMGALLVWLRPFYTPYLVSTILKMSHRSLSSFKRDIPPAMKPIVEPMVDSASKPQPPPEPPPQKTYPKDTFVLNGTIQMGNRQVALINSKIYEIGDLIGDKKIININLNKVDIQDGENIITLNVGDKKETK